MGHYDSNEYKNVDSTKIYVGTVQDFNKEAKKYGEQPIITTNPNKKLWAFME